MKNTFKSIAISVFFLLCSFMLNAQNGTKQFEFDDFFKNYTFNTPGVRELRSMKDGITRAVRYMIAHEECHAPDPEYDKWCDEIIGSAHSI